MKTSKILFISFFVLIIALLAVFSVKYFHRDVEEYKAKEGFVKIEEEVPSFSYLVVEKGVRVWVKNSDSTSYFTFQEHKDSAVIMPKYQLKGDTLVLTSVETSSNNHVSIYAPNMRSCTVRGRVDLQNGQKVYQVNLQGGRVAVHGHHTKQFNLVAKGGHLDFWGKKLETFNAEVQNAEVYLKNCKIDSATIVAKGKSRVTINQTLRLSVEKDEKARVEVRN